METDKNIKSSESAAQGTANDAERVVVGDSTESFFKTSPRNKHLVLDHDGKTIWSKDLEHIKIKVDRLVIPDSKNYQYLIKFCDTRTGAEASSNISNINAAVTELINAGSIDLCRPKEARELQALIDFIVQEAVANPEIVSNSHMVIGWRTVSGEDVYFGNDVISASRHKKVDSEYLGNNTVEITRRGTTKEWVDGVNEYIAPKIVPSIIMISSFAGIIRQRYKSLANDTQLVINIVGESSCGKTTMVKLAHTPFTSQEAYLGYSTSLGSRTKRLALRNPIVASIDDVLQMPSLKDRKPENINELIFSLASGMSKDRLGQYGELREQEKFDSSVLLTSTATLLDKTGKDDVGQLSRLIEISVTKEDMIDGVDDSDRKKQIDDLTDILESNHGNAAEAFVWELVYEEYVNGGKECVENSLLDNYCTVRDSIRDKLRNKNVKNTRIANRYALIVVIAEMLNNKLGTEFLTDDIEDYLVDNAVETQNNFYGNNDAVVKIAAYFKKYQEVFHQGIIQPENDTQTADDWLKKYIGIYSFTSSGDLELSVPCGDKYKRLEFMLYDVAPQYIFERDYEGNFSNLPTVDYDYFEKVRVNLKEKGISHTKSTGLYKKNIFVSKCNQISCYELTIPKMYL